MEKFGDKVGTMQPTQRSFDVDTICAIVPKEVFALCQFVGRPDGGIYALECVGMISGIIDLSGDSHWSGREILYLLEMEVEGLGLYSKLCHVDLTASWMRGYEIGDELLSQTAFAIDSFEKLPEFVEKTE